MAMTTEKAFRLPDDAILVGRRGGEEVYYSRSLDRSYIVWRTVFGDLGVRTVRGKIAGCCG